MQENPQTWLSFFGLHDQPFAPTADPAYFYATRAHKECLFRLWNHVEERYGIAVVLGDYGTGKTTLLRKLISGMHGRTDRYATAVLASPIPSWTSFSLLENIVSQFGPPPGTRSFAAYMERLCEEVLARQDRIVTLVIDDAQNLNKRGQLELLRLVQNLETPQHKLLNLVLFAQMEWADILRAAPNFEQRVNMTYTLQPLDIKETRELIDFRIRQAGAGDRAPVFEESAIRAIHAYAQGSPRVTVTVCRNALVLAAQLKARRVGQAIILHTIQRTMLPDAEKQARVVAVLEPAAEPASAPRAAASDAGVVPSKRRSLHPYAEKANRMLLRSPAPKPENGRPPFAGPTDA